MRREDVELRVGVNLQALQAQQMCPLDLITKILMRIDRPEPI